MFGACDRSEWGNIRNMIRSGIKSCLYSKTKRTPLIQTVFIEVD